MPVGSDSSAPKNKQIISGMASKYNIDVHFPQYTKEKAFRPQAIVDELTGSLFVVANLSLERPSCYYELGIAEALGKDVFIIAETGSDIHQSANRDTVRFYKRGEKGFSEAIRLVLKHAFMKIQ